MSNPNLMTKKRFTVELMQSGLVGAITSPLVGFWFSGGFNNPYKVLNSWLAHWTTIIWHLPLIGFIFASCGFTYVVLLRLVVLANLPQQLHGVLRFILVSLVGFVLGAATLLTSDLLCQALVGAHVYPRTNGATFIASAGYIGVIVANMTFFLHMNALDLCRAEELRAELEKRRQESRLQALSMRIQPHFFFNALNTLASLIDIDKHRAQDFLLDLSDLFRKTFAHGKESHLCTWSEERHIIETYLRLEQSRFGPKLHWDMQVEAEDDAPFPAFLLQPLVENAIHHGISKLKQIGTLHIEGRYHQDRWDLKVRNATEGKAQVPIAEGHALDVIHQRIELMQGEMHIQCVPGQTTIALSWVN